MSYQNIDMSKYKRKSHFDYFKSMAYPYVGVTVNVDITNLADGIKEKRFPFFLSFCYCVARAANHVPEFRQRIYKDGIIEFDNCKTSHTVALDDETYCYCSLECTLPFKEYLPYAVRVQEEAKEAKNTEDDEDVKDLIFISTVPWFSYNSMVQPVPMPADSNPRITWGRYFEQEGKLLIPVSVLCNHALVDGRHISQFYEALNREITGLMTVK